MIFTSIVKVHRLVHLLPPKFRAKFGCEFCTEVNQFLPDPERSEISFYKTLKRNLLHIESEVEKSQVELDIEIRRAPPKFEGTCKKNQNKYDNKRELFDNAQQIVKDLGDSKI
jgi:hypothetical protein